MIMQRTTTEKDETLKRGLEKLYEDYVLMDMYGKQSSIESALDEGRLNEATRDLGRMCLTINEYDGRTTDSQAAWDTYNKIIIPGLIGKLIKSISGSLWIE